MCIRRETREKARRSLAFSRVSKPHTHITHMLRQCTSIVYFSIAEILLKVTLNTITLYMACIQNNANLHTKKIKTLNILDEIPIGESTSLPVFHQYFLALLYTRLKCTSRLYISSRSETYHWVCN